MWLISLCGCFNGLSIFCDKKIIIAWAVIKDHRDLIGHIKFKLQILYAVRPDLPK